MHWFPSGIFQQPEQATYAPLHVQLPLLIRPEQDHPFAVRHKIPTPHRRVRVSDPP